MGIFSRLKSKKQTVTGEQLVELVVTFIQAGTWAESQKIVTDNPALLSAEAAVILEAMRHHYQHDREAAGIIQAHQELLARCREEGIEAAFAGQARPITTNLGAVLHELSQPAQLRDMPQRVALCQEALALVSRSEQPELWAALQNEMGNCLAQNPLGPRADNLEAALTHYQNALAVYTREAFPEQWAMTQNNLATAYSDRIRGERADNLEAALTHYQNALAVYTREAFPADWAMTQNNLATAYRNRIRGERADNLEAALTHYQNALQVRTREAFPADWAMTQNNLATAYSDRIRGERADNLEAALTHYQNALAVYTLALVPHEHRRVQRSLGHLHFEQQAWAAAATAYAGALSAAEYLYQASVMLEARQSELAEIHDLPARAAYCLAHQKQWAEAVTVLEQNKARALADTLTRREAIFTAVSAPDEHAFRQLCDQIQALEAESRAEGEAWAREYRTVAADLRQARLALADLITHIHTYAPDFLPQGLDFPAMAAIAADLQQPLVYLLTTPQGSLALVIPPSSQDQDVIPVWLPTFREEDLNQILYDQDGEGGYLRGAAGGNILVLEQMLVTMWPALQEHLMQPLVVALKKWHEAVLIPVGRLGLLPLPALAVDEITFSLAPSARALQTALAGVHQRSQQPPQLLGVGNPAANGQHALPFSQIEVEEIAPLFAGSDACFYKTEAVRSGIVQALPGTTHLHFSCHGQFNMAQPLRSALYLAGEDTLTLQMLLSGDLDITAVRLAVLSACKTGITDFRQVPDEAIGFPAGFLQAGIPGVVSTLWPVPDFSTMLVMQHFYQLHLREGKAPVVALRQAQLWLRNLTREDLKGLFKTFMAQAPDKPAEATTRMPHNTAAEQYSHYVFSDDWEERPFAHPSYWAAFVFTGV